MRTAFLFEIFELGEFLDIVRNIRAVIVAAIFQIANHHFILTDIVQQERLDGIDVVHLKAMQLRPQHIEKMPVESLYQSDNIEIWITHDTQ